MIDPWTSNYFAPQAEQATLYANDVSHLPEAPTPLIEAKLTERVQVRKAAMRSHAEWFATTFGKDGVK